jgi:hypothetical protein
MISFEMEDLIGVLQGLKPYFIAIGVLLIAAIVITAAVGKKEKKLKSLIRKETWIAVIAGILASILGGLGTNESVLKLNLDITEGEVSLAIAGKTILSTVEHMDHRLAAFMVGGAIYIAAFAILCAVFYFVLGSVVETGYARFHLDLNDGEDSGIETLFSYFYNWKTTAAARLLRSLYTLLWSLLFVIPGIIASYSYAMTGYILAEHPEYTAQEAIAQSKEMMAGNRFRLFCLQLSFIGWSVLCLFTFGIGNLWLRPYVKAATAAFYREISGTN